MATSIVRDHVERPAPETFGQGNHMRVVLRRGQAVHEYDDGASLSVEQPGAGRQLHAVAREQPRTPTGCFGHHAPSGRRERRRACMGRGVSSDHLKVIRSKSERLPRSLATSPPFDHGVAPRGKTSPHRPVAAHLSRADREVVTAVRHPSGTRGLSHRGGPSDRPRLRIRPPQGSMQAGRGGSPR